MKDNIDINASTIISGQELLAKVQSIFAAIWLR